MYRPDKNSHDLNKRLYYCIISTSHAREPCLSHITQNSVCSRFEFGESGVLKNVFILSKHGTKANIRSTKMANNRRRFLTVLVDRRLLGSQCCLSTRLVANNIRLTKRCNALSSRSGEKTNTNQQCERLAKIRQTTGNIWSWRQGIAAFG
jgi:hypothetical protein